MACSSNCPTKDHATFGECLRAKGIQIDRHSLLVNGSNLDKKRDHTLGRFRQCVEAGLTPQAPTKTAVERAERTLNV